MLSLLKDNTNNWLLIQNRRFEKMPDTKEKEKKYFESKSA